MRIEYDTVHDLLNIEFLSHVPINESQEIEGIVIDFAKDKRIVAIEVLDASKRTTRDPMSLINLAIVQEKLPQSGMVREQTTPYQTKKKIR